MSYNPQPALYSCVIFKVSYQSLDIIGVYITAMTYKACKTEFGLYGPAMGYLLMGGWVFVMTEQRCNLRSTTRTVFFRHYETLHYSIFMITLST